MAVGVSERVKGEVDSENSNDAQISGDVDMTETAAENALTPGTSPPVPNTTTTNAPEQKPKASRPRNRRKDSNHANQVVDDNGKRRCVSTACIACRRRKSKCDGNLPACAACSSVYNTECIYDPNSDHRRKGVYKKDMDKLKTRNSTLEVLIQAILNYAEEDVPELIRKIRTCDSLDVVAEGVIAKENGMEEEDEELEAAPETQPDNAQPTFESHMSGRMAELRLEDGSTRYIGGTSNLIYLGAEENGTNGTIITSELQNGIDGEKAVSWTNVTDDEELTTHLLNLYFNWHYPYFTTLSKTLFYRDYKLGKPTGADGRPYCTSLLVNAMLALGCHFTAWRGAREDPEDPTTAGDHFFREAKRLILENDEHEKPRLSTVQALALMSVREAGCGREAKGWVYSGMSFRMACDLGLNLDSGSLTGAKDPNLDDEGVDARRITFWGCFLFDKCWSNYLGRLPQLPQSSVTVPKFEVWPAEESEIWAAYTDSGFNQSHAQPARTRAVALQISEVCEISADLMNHFYNPIDMDKAKGKQAELKKLSDIHQRLETWRRNLPPEMEPREGGLPGLLLMHMFFQLLYIHLFRPFLKYSQATSPLPANVSPRRLCTQAAAAISKLLRLYKRSHGLRQICNIAVYIAHSACTIHLLNLPDKNAKRDITHGVKHLEEIAESWPCAKRTLAILSALAKKWKVDLPEDAAAVLARTDAKFGTWLGEMPVKSRSVTGTPSPKALAPIDISGNAPVAQRPVVPSPLSPTTASFVPAAVGPQHQLQQQQMDAIHRRMSQMTNLPPSITNSFSTPITPTAGAPTASTFQAQATERANFPAQPPLRSIHTNNIMSPNRGQPQYQPGPPMSSGGSPHQINSSRASSTSPSNNVQQAQTNSPAGLFGGVEQLLRDSNDWWIRDQSQIAVGFERWPMANSYDLDGERTGQSTPIQPQQPHRSVPASWTNGPSQTPNAQLASAIQGRVPMAGPYPYQQPSHNRPTSRPQPTNNEHNNASINPNLAYASANMNDQNNQNQWIDGYIGNAPPDFESVIGYSNEEDWYK